MSESSALSVLSTVWRYVRVQLFVFAVGIVGPIFLVAYFASQPDPEVRFMYWVGLIVTTVDVLVALFITASHQDARAKGPKPPISR